MRDIKDKRDLRDLRDVADIGLVGSMGLMGSSRVGWVLKGSKVSKMNCGCGFRFCNP